MSTIDKAFVQAFARRQQATHGPATQSPANQGPSAPQPVTNPSTDAHAGNIPTGEAPSSGGLHVDPSVAGSTQVWVDPIEDRIARVISGQSETVPSPHFPPAAAPQPANQQQVQQPPTQPSHSPADDTAIEPVMVSPHVHTAYVYSPPMSDASTVDAPPTEPAPTPQPSFDEVVTFHQRIDEPQSETPSPAGRIDAYINKTEPTEDVVEDVEVAAEATESVSAIHPIWEVDALDVPARVAELFFEEALFESVAHRLSDAVKDGLRSMMVTSAQSGEGRSTISIGMAIAASATGLRVALVDGDAQEPTLVDDLRLDVEFGWADTLRGGLPLDQIAVYSIQDNLTFIPLMPAKNESSVASVNEVQRLAESLKGKFDLVVIDAPNGTSSLVEVLASLVDSAVIARDASRTDDATVDALAKRLSDCGLKGVGVVENFA